jgi:uncharacterized protein (TIGR00375 family)
MNEYFLDLHIHIGRTKGGQAVKITASRDLTLFSIIREAAERKGIDIIGIIDASSPPVLEEFRELVEDGELIPLEGGGLSYQGKVTILLGAEVETAGPSGGTAHFGIWMPDLKRMGEFSRWLADRVTNPVLSSQRANTSASELQRVATDFGGMFIINHAFTPHKSVYGNCVSSAREMLDLSRVTALELGLSSDSDLADLFSELQDITFVSNSDAHSLAKIGREYNKILVRSPSFEEVKKSLLRQEGRCVTANYGLTPTLGKYHRTYCLPCKQIVTDPPPVIHCPRCGSTHVVLGVIDRIYSIADRNKPVHPLHRPPYYYQVPLEFIPKIGKRTIDKLLAEFGTEMNILHRANEDDLARIVGEKIANDIVLARTGRLPLVTGGGGKYGRVEGNH